MNSAPDNCPHCGAPLADGVCPQCLLLAGIEPTPTTSRARWVPPTPEELQAQLTQYQVLELLGQGGMGAVYKGWQTSLERYVAIKVLPPGLTEEDEPFTARFKHEAKTMARFSHPAIVGVHDYGETAEGLCYIVMEFIEGTDVQRMMAEQERLPPEHALAIAMHVCDALVYAHANGIIHRDIKPANVMVDTQGRVRVADFGLAKAADAGGTLLTATNMALGTPGYIAPETLIMGMSVDARADVYAVGVMLYAMLTGRVPHGRFEAASVRVPGLDPRFDDIINRAMQDERESRYASAAELRADLATILNEPESAVSARFAEAVSSTQMKKTRAAPATAEAPPRARPPMMLIGLAAVAVCAIGLQIWKPWAKSEGGAVATTKAQGNVAKPPAKVAQSDAKKPGSPQVSSANPATPAPKTTPPAESASRGNSTQPTQSPVVATAAPPKPSDAPAAASETSKPPAAPTLTPNAGGTASSGPSPTVQNVALVTPAAAAAVAPAPAASEKVALPPELAALDAQFQSLQVERVAAPFEAEVVKLNTSYVGGLEREMPKEKAAGHLDGVLALEAEKKLLNDHQPVPSLEEETASDKETPAALKSLRVTYREAHAKLEAQRAANLKALTDPLAARLQTLESELTKKDRIADAKVVREYRESLGSALVGDVATEIAAVPATARAAAPNPITPTVGAGALKDGFTNTLGMKFADVSGTKVLFCIHETRGKDYAAYVAEVPGVNDEWKKQKREGIVIRVDEDFPVVGVSWDDAQAFCAWLSKKEGRTYRLPTDREWSFAMGIGRNETVTKDTTPASLSSKMRDVHPWGNLWPPPKGMGNFADTSHKEKFTARDLVPDYSDGFPATAPVMHFKPNKLGLYDMSGNVWEWCEDWFDEAKKERVLRGGSWKSGARSDLFSAVRKNTGQDHRYDDHGFRVVVEVDARPSSAAPAPPPRTPLITPTVGPTALKDGFTNTLGMKFARVTGTKVLFCIHTTRVKDYAAYASEVPGVNDDWKKQMREGSPVSDKADDPVVGVSWDDAQTFCAWLNKKEGRIYRLPTDREWSFAVGIGNDEKATKDSTPESLSRKIPDVFPWGNQWPPPKGAGNYADTTCKEKFPTLEIIAGYTDGYPTSSPVMSFKPNKFGLYDMGGNVWQWCEDWHNMAKTDRVLRGGSWFDHERGNLPSSARFRGAPGLRVSHYGFRVVVEADARPSALAPPPQTVAVPPPRPR